MSHMTEHRVRPERRPSGERYRCSNVHVGTFRQRLMLRRHQQESWPRCVFFKSLRDRSATLDKPKAAAAIRGHSLFLSNNFTGSPKARGACNGQYGSPDDLMILPIALSIMLLFPAENYTSAFSAPLFDIRVVLSAPRPIFFNIRRVTRAVDD
jgi:hypothetical protein